MYLCLIIVVMGTSMVNSQTVCPPPQFSSKLLVRHGTVGHELDTLENVIYDYVSYKASENKAVWSYHADYVDRTIVDLTKEYAYVIDDVNQICELKVGDAFTDLGWFEFHMLLGDGYTQESTARRMVGGTEVAVNRYTKSGYVWAANWFDYIYITQVKETTVDDCFLVYLSEEKTLCAGGIYPPQAIELMTVLSGPTVTYIRTTEEYSTSPTPTLFTFADLFVVPDICPPPPAVTVTLGTDPDPDT